MVTRAVPKEIGPSVRNAGGADAQAHLHSRLEDLHDSCCEPEFGYWPRQASSGARDGLCRGGRTGGDRPRALPAPPCTRTRTPSPNPIIFR